MNGLKAADLTSGPLLIRTRMSTPYPGRFTSTLSASKSIEVKIQKSMNYEGNPTKIGVIWHENTPKLFGGYHCDSKF